MPCGVRVSAGVREIDTWVALLLAVIDVEGVDDNVIADGVLDGVTLDVGVIDRVFDMERELLMVAVCDRVELTVDVIDGVIDDVAVMDAVTDKVDVIDGVAVRDTGDGVLLGVPDKDTGVFVRV